MNIPGYPIFYRIESLFTESVLSPLTNQQKRILVTAAAAFALIVAAWFCTSRLCFKGENIQQKTLKISPIM